LKFRFDGKEKRLSLGVYPDVPLKDARDRRDIARKLLADGIDPSENRKAQKLAHADSAANSFEVVAREWLSKYFAIWATNHGDRIIRRFERDIFPWIGGRPVAEITAPEVLTVVRRIESLGALETAHRTLSNCGQVFRYAIATGRAKHDPSGDLRGALPPSDEYALSGNDRSETGCSDSSCNGWLRRHAYGALRLAPCAIGICTPRRIAQS
jgi:hypothetical protein